MAEKRYLLTPGPTPVPPEVLAAMALPIVHHRSPDFRPTYRQVPRAAAGGLPHASDEVLLYTASGTAALESAVANLCSPGDRVVVVSAGYFGERWADIAARLRLRGRRASRYEWGETPSRRRPRVAARRAGRREGRLPHALGDLDRASSRDVAALAAAAKEAGALVVVDAISSLGAVPLETDAWGIDVVVSGSQKALMTPPGPGDGRRVSDAAWDARERASSPRFYFDWERTRDGAGEARRRVHAGRLARHRPQRRARHDPRARASRRRSTATSASAAPAARASKAMGLELFSPDDDRSAVVTAIRVPEGIDGDAVPARPARPHGDHARGRPGRR